MTAAQQAGGMDDGLALDEIPAEVAEAAKLHLLDTLGCGLAAARARHRHRRARDDGRARWRRAGDRDRRPAPAGRQRGLRERNGLPRPRLRRHTLRLRRARQRRHLPCLAGGGGGGRLGRSRGARGDSGCERGRDAGRHGRVGASSTARGFHPTAVCGVFGATACAARLGGLDAGRATSALGIAGSLASGLFAYLEDGTPTKPIHPAWAAHGGLVAARLAAHGAEGPPSIFEGKFGLYHAFLGARGRRDRPGVQLADLGTRWETLRIAFKPYPACHFMHGAVGRDGRRRPQAASRPTSRGDRRQRAGGGSRSRARAGGREGRPAHDLRGEVQPPVLGRRHARPRPLRRHDVCGGRDPRSARPRARPACPL